MLFGSSMLSSAVCLGFGCSLLATTLALPTQSSSRPSESLGIQLANNASTTTLTGFVPSQCWPGIPAPRARKSISQSRDCRDAAFQSLAGGAMEPVYWDSSYTWTRDSCSVRLIPAVVSSRDVFTRYDIFRAASRIQTSCVNEAHGYRGGIMGVGQARMFDVSVEAARNSPLYKGETGASNRLENE